MYAEEQFDIHFKNCGGGMDHLKFEINYLERMPVAGTVKGRLVHPFDDLDPVETLTYRSEELFAGKMRAYLREHLESTMPPILRTIRIDGLLSESSLSSISRCMETLEPWEPEQWRV